MPSFSLVTLGICGRLDLASLKRELQVLSEQYSQKCLEIGNLTEKAEEREQMLQCCQQEGKELLRQNQARDFSLEVKLPGACFLDNQKPL